MSKIADPKPPYCAACFSFPEGRCVDFEAAYDGPVIPGSPAHVPVDDLIICEGCLGEAFSLLDPQGLHETIAELTQMVQDQQDQLDSKDRAIQGFRKSTNELIDHPVASLPGKPKLEGVPPEIRTKIMRNTFKRNGTSSAAKVHKETKRKEQAEEAVA